MIGVFCLLPINVSKKNRMYKVIGLIFKFLIREKIFVYQKEGVNKVEEATSVTEKETTEKVPECMKNLIEYINKE